MILAPLRGVTIKCFREVFAEVICECGFTEAFTPFISAMPGLSPLCDRELSDASRAGNVALTPQFIGKDPQALRRCLTEIREAGYETADLNCGCPFPMVRNKGRGSGMLKTPELLRKMLEVGVEVMGEGKFSLKARIGVDRRDELLEIMPVVNEFPLRFLTVHGRLAKQMYEGTCDTEMVDEIERVSAVPVVRNGDLDWREGCGMVGRSFIRYLGEREDIGDLLSSYIEASRLELHGERPVLGRMKELIAYWKDLPQWRRRWQSVKISRNLDELRSSAMVRLQA
jgi:tRNA-dihydrouridine synthase